MDMHMEKGSVKENDGKKRKAVLAYLRGGLYSEVLRGARSPHNRPVSTACPMCLRLKFWLFIAKLGPDQHPTLDLSQEI